MSLNQIINMILRIVMRKTISKGIDAGINRATRGRSPQGKQQQRSALPEDFEENHDQTGKPTQDEVRRQRQAKRAARQARQAAKVTGKIGRM